MSSQCFELNTIHHRLERLEKQNNRLKSLLVVVGIFTCTLFLLGQARPSRIVEAEKFLLKDSTGKIRGEFSLKQVTYFDKRTVLEPRLIILDENQKEVSWLGTSRLTLKYPNNSELFLTPGMITSRSGSLEDPKSENHFSLMSVGNGVMFELGDVTRKGRHSISMNVTEDGSTVNSPFKEEVSIMIKDGQGFQTILLAIL